jgi:hypothetical protein
VIHLSFPSHRIIEAYFEHHPLTKPQYELFERAKWLSKDDFNVTFARDYVQRHPRVLDIYKAVARVFDGVSLSMTPYYSTSEMDYHLRQHGLVRYNIFEFEIQKRLGEISVKVSSFEVSMYSLIPVLVELSLSCLAGKSPQQVGLNPYTYALNHGYQPQRIEHGALDKRWEKEHIFEYGEVEVEQDKSVSKEKRRDYIAELADAEDWLWGMF